MMETAYPESPLDFEDAAYPCKGCGEILEEGKAFELAGNRWHIDCFRCNSCRTLLDSDANLLLLGDGSLICNNCTYSCSSCGNKIEDLAILTGDQAFCANCFKCRNCKRKIENLRYARTSQGIFCMDCHEALMARRRKKSARGASGSKKNGNSSLLDKSLPSLPPSKTFNQSFDAGTDTLWSDAPSASTANDVPSITRTLNELRGDIELEGDSTHPAAPSQPQGLTLPSTTYRNKRHSIQPVAASDNAGGAEEFLIPLAFDPTPVQDTPASHQATPQLQDERSPSRNSNNAPLLSPAASSPHIAFQEKGHNASQEQVDQAASDKSFGHSDTQIRPPFLPERNRQRSGDGQPIAQLARADSPRREPFVLQEAPRVRTDSRSGASTPRADSKDRVRSPVPQEHPLRTSSGNITPAVSQDASTAVNGFAEPPKASQSSMSGVMQNIPKRGDSLESANAANKRTIPRKEIKPSSLNSSITTEKKKDSAVSPIIAELPGDYALPSSSTKVISAPITSPASQSILDTPNAQQQGDSEAGSQSFVEPRAAPQPPADMMHARSGSLGNIQNDPLKPGEQQRSPKLPRWSGAGDFTLEEDMARILGGEEPSAHESFLRRVSNSVRHGRSHSDKSGRMSRDRWPRSPAISTTPGHDIGSPNTTSPDNRDELSYYKTELRREKEKNVERDKKIAELEARFDSSANIKQVNSELREKRSTMVVLDTQREMAVRELETLSQHIAKTKGSQEPFDSTKLSNSILRDFAQSLERLKNSIAPQIEELIQKRSDMLAELAQLNTMKDKSFQEFEQLSSKNAQLAELNNQLVHQIQDIYKANTGLSVETNRSPAPNGLGIYSHQKDKSQVSIDSRELRPVQTEGSIAESGTTLREDVEPIQVIGGPNVVSIKKMQPKKFDWRRGQKVAKGMAKGVKGAFSSTQQSYNRDLQFAETGAYGQLPNSQEYGQGQRPINEQQKPGFGFFAAQKGQVKGNGLYAAPQTNTSTPSLTLDPATHLFGSDLEQRADFEKTTIPAIVKRCVEEVESRGMDQEGIYRKSGGNSQVQQVKDSFENPGSDFSISDPELDIHAVTSCLKQFFRKLPSPLITYEVYDRLLEATNVPDGATQKSQRIDAIAEALHELPKAHYSTLEYLIRHLARVVVREKENLMTPLNIAVVFAPTIMRPESVSRELTDTKAKNEVVMWMVESYEQVFGN